jgi:hypothetical protein
MKELKAVESFQLKRVDFVELKQPIKRVAMAKVMPSRKKLTRAETEKKFENLVRMDCT